VITKTFEKEQAIALRTQGYTYSEIIAIVPVSKSTLSLWLHDVGLAKKQLQRLTEKRHQAQIRGGQARRDTRIAETELIFADAKTELGTLSKRDLFVIGVALYWGEGTKQKTYRPSVRLCFTNSDPDMVRTFMKWMRLCTDVPDSDIGVEVYIHDNYKMKTAEFKRYWLGITGLAEQNVIGVVYKKHNPKTKRKNCTDTYKGLVAIKVKRSTMLNRRVQGCINAIVQSL
jgi:hypothetical protein